MAIIDVFNKLSDGRAGMVDILISGGVGLFGFEGLHKALRHGIVIRAARTAHAGLDAGSFQAGDVVAAGVLNAPIGLVDQLAGTDIALSQGHIERAQGDGRGEMILQRPADHLAAERIQHHRQIGFREAIANPRRKPIFGVFGVMYKRWRTLQMVR